MTRVRIPTRYRVRTHEPMNPAHADTIWDRIGTQLSNPSGVWGRMTGRVMGIANATPNSLAVAALEAQESECLLELGCGPGHALKALLRLPGVGRAIGLDWSDVMLAQSSRRNRAVFDSGRLALVRGDFAELPLEDGSVDRVLAVNTVYFMRDSTAVREARRVLRTGGRIVLYATHASVMRHWLFAGPDTHRLYDHDTLETLLVEAGFASESVHVESVDAGFGVKGLLATAEK